MLLSYSRPSYPTVTAWYVFGTGAEFLTDPIRLTNGRPTSRTRIRWLSGSQTTASVLTLQMVTYDGTSGVNDIRLLGLYGVTLPVGTKVTCKRKFDLSYTDAQTARVVERPDGVRVVWFYYAPQPDAPRSSFQFEIFNDVNGSPEIPADSSFDIGEVWAGMASEWNIRTTYESNQDDLSKQKISLGGQPFTVTRRAVTVSQVEFTPVPYVQAFGSVGMSYIRRQIQGLRPCVVVPMTNEPFTGGGVDMDYVMQNAEFGFAKALGPIVGEAPRFVFSATFNAPPALLP